MPSEEVKEAGGLVVSGRTPGSAQPSPEPTLGSALHGRAVLIQPQG